MASDQDGMGRAGPAQQAYPDDSSPFAPARRRSLLQRTIPVSEQLRRYGAGTARRDLLAGVTVAALAVPAAMAYAELAGLSPVNGLYALLLPTVAYVLLGSSHQLVVGPEGSISALVAVSVLSFAAAGTADAAELAAILALLVSVCFLAAFVLRLGWLADYFSRPVLIGYIHGVAVVLIIGQLGKLTGIGIGARGPVPQLVEAGKEIGNVSGATLAVAAIALAVMLPLRWIAPRFPAALVVVIAGIAASAWLKLDAHGVAVVGHIPSGLPSLTFPTPPLNQVFDLVPGALGLFLVSFADEVLTARAYAQRHGERIDVGQEMRAMAVANATAGVSQGFPVGASGSRTAVNDSMGARSQVSALLAAIAVVGILLFLTAPIAHLPKAVLGAAIVSAAVGLIDISSWRALAAADRVEVAIAAITTAGVVRFANVADHPEARVEPGIVVYRLDDRLFFANARYVMGRMRQAMRGAPTPPHWLVLDAEGISHIDTTGMEALKNLVGELGDGGVALVVARMRTTLQGLLDDAGLEAEIGADHFYPTVRAAVSACVREESGRRYPAA